MGSSFAIKIISIILATLFVILLGFGPKPLYEEYPNTVWVSNDPQIYMTVSSSPYDHSGSYVVVNGEKIEVVLYISKREDLAHINLLSADGKSGTTVLVGDHVRINDSEISWNVTHDYLFDEAYSTITLERQRDGTD